MPQASMTGEHSDGALLEQGQDAGEFDQTPVTPGRLLSARHFAATYAGEHVAGTEFVIGAMFVAWGVSTSDVIGGLLLGNLLAVLSWALLCAPIATQTRLTLYAYLEKIAGPGVIRLYSVINGIFFCVLGGAMITVSASAVRILFDIPPQVDWYPTSLAFVAVALGVGAVVVTIAVRGFAIVARFSEVCAPWMILMFAAGALALWPVLAAQTEAASSTGFVDALWQVGDTYIWVANPNSEMNFWHVAAFAWICNAPLHIGMSDMTVLRFAKRARYGYFSALGMYIGHFGAWVCAGIMGAGAALLLGTSIQALDAGGVAYQGLGSAGIVAVIIAGWTTSNPTIYRAGLAFQSLNHRWNRRRVTIVTGAITTAIACFPFVFTRLMDFLGLMGLLMAPIGAVIVTEHWLFPRLGLTRYWASQRQRFLNPAVAIAWVGGLLVAALAYANGLHLFFLMLPAWFSAMALHLIASRLLGAHEAGPVQSAPALDQNAHAADAGAAPAASQSLPPLVQACRVVAWLSLVTCLVMALATFYGGSLEVLRTWLILPSLLYFFSATYWINQKEKRSTAR